jgi:hypothetical protein
LGARQNQFSEDSKKEKNLVFALRHSFPQNNMAGVGSRESVAIVLHQDTVL